MNLRELFKFAVLLIYNLISLQEEQFILPVYYNNDYCEFPATLQLMGYTHKITIRVGEQDVIFEPDEERNYRAVIPDGVDLSKKDIELLKAIVQALDEAFG